MATRAAQQQFEAMADKKDKVLTKLAEEFVDARDRRMALTKIERKAKVALLIKMQEKELETYHCPDTGLVVVLEEGDFEIKVITDATPEKLDAIERKKQEKHDGPKTVDVKARASGEKDDEDEDDWSEPLTKRDVPQPGERKLLPPAGGSKKRKKAAA